MRIVVTGTRGLLGAAIGREFGSDHELLGLDRAGLDITNSEAVETAIASSSPDVLINCAADNDVDGAEDDPARALCVNAFGVRALARASTAAGAVLVHFSSDFVFDGETDRPYTEEDRPNPRGAYGASKLLGEWFALESPRTYVLRVESLFGPPAPGGSRRGSLGTIVDRIREGADVPVFVDRIVSPSYTPDIARAVRALLEKGVSPGLYHCVNDGCATWKEIAERAAALMGIELRMRALTLETASLRAKRPRYCAMSNAKLAAAGIRLRPWEEALEEFLLERTP